MTRRSPGRSRKFGGRCLYDIIGSFGKAFRTRAWMCFDDSQGYEMWCVTTSGTLREFLISFLYITSWYLILLALEIAHKLVFGLTSLFKLLFEFIWVRIFRTSTPMSNVCESVWNTLSTMAWVATWRMQVKCLSVGFKLCKSIVMFLLVSSLTLTSMNTISDLELSDVNLTVVCKLIVWLMKLSISSSEWVYIIKVSSIKRYQTSGSLGAEKVLFTL